MEERDLLERVTRTIVEKFQPRRVILFGSRARGEARPDSDIDLLIEMETTRTPPERAIAVSAAFGLRPWPLDVARLHAGGSETTARRRRHAAVGHRAGRASAL